MRGLSIRLELTGQMRTEGGAGRPTGLFAPPSAAAREVEHLAVRIAARILLLTTGFVIALLLAWHLRAILLLVGLGLFVAVIVNPFVRVLASHGLSRMLAVAIVYSTLVVLVAALGYVFVHPVVQSATRFAHDLPSLVRQAQAGKGPVGRLVARLHLASYVNQHAPALEHEITKLSRPALDVGKTVVSGVVSLITIAFLSLFMVLELPRIFDKVLAFLPPERAAQVRRTTEQMTNQVTGFMLGDLATSIIAGLVVFVALEVTGVPFAVVLSLWLGLVDFLPLIGGLIGGIPAIGVAFLHSTTAGIVTVVLFVVYQQIENHFLNPLIISKTVRLNPFWVLLAVLFGASIGDTIAATFGAICGAIVAVPVAGAIQVLGGELVRSRAARREDEQVAD